MESGGRTLSAQKLGEKINFHYFHNFGGLIPGDYLLPRPYYCRLYYRARVTPPKCSRAPGKSVKNGTLGDYFPENEKLFGNHWMSRCLGASLTKRSDQEVRFSYAENYLTASRLSMPVVPGKANTA